MTTKETPKTPKDTEIATLRESIAKDVLRYVTLQGKLKAAPDGKSYTQHVGYNKLGQSISFTDDTKRVAIAISDVYVYPPSVKKATLKAENDVLKAKIATLEKTA